MSCQDLTGWITEAAGEVVFSDFTGELDFLIVPVLWSGRAKQLHHQLVNKHWIENCLDAGKLLPVSYQHIPLSGDWEGEPPLAGVVACLSGYTSSEREYLNSLVQHLGGQAQVVALLFCLEPSYYFDVLGTFCQEGQPGQEDAGQLSPDLS